MRPVSCESPRCPTCNSRMACFPDKSWRCPKCAPHPPEEPSSAPAPCPNCQLDLELVAKTVDRIKYLEEVERKFEAHVCPAPAGDWEQVHSLAAQAADELMRHDARGLVVMIRDIAAQHLPEPGEPGGTQTPNTQPEKE